MVADPLARRPRAATYRVRDLVKLVDEGKIRIPSFQRRLCWGPGDRQLLFDSIYRGYPIGTILLWQQPARAGRLVLGPIVREVPEVEDALWVIDGQQRLTALAACLLLSPNDPGYEDFNLVFDLERREVVGPSRSRVAGPRWLPLHRTLAQPDLSKWVVDQGLASDALRSHLAFRFGDAVRDYEIPAVIVDTDDERVLRQVFQRTNTAGKGLRAAEVFQALHMGLSGESPASVPALLDELAQLGYGRLDERQVLSSALAIAGEDPAESTPALDRLPGAQVGIVQAAVEPLRKTLVFLVTEAEIPRLELLPFSLPVTVLASLFARFEMVSERDRLLLVRWLWRGILTGGLRGSDIGEVRELLRATRLARETDSVQALLRLVPQVRPETFPSAGESLNLGRATPKVVLASMFALEPVNLKRFLEEDAVVPVAAADFA